VPKQAAPFNAGRVAAPLLVLLVLGAVAHGATMVGGGPFEQFAVDVLYHVVVAGGALACLLRAVLVRGERLAWMLVGLGTACWAAGDIVSAFAPAGDRPLSPSLADSLNLASYPLSAAGVLMLARGRIRLLRGQLGLDSAIAAFGATALGAAMLGPALVGYGEGETLAAIVDIAYPVADLILFAVTAGAAVLLGWRSDFILLALGLIAVGVADTAYLYAEATAGYVEGTLLDTAWMLAAALIALAAWQRPTAGSEPLSGGRSIALPALFALLAVLLLTSDHFSQLPDAAIMLAAGTLVLAVARMVLAYWESSRLLGAARTDARTDALTGLGNRRRLIADLEHAGIEAANGDARYLFAIFDLDGFKVYNDSFGHAAGDLLLRRMGNSLSAAVQGHGTAYRLGGDEFCVLAPLGRTRPSSIVAAASAALREDGEGFVITASHGEAMIPAEAPEPTQALRLADRRLYAEKGRSPRSFERQARDLLLNVLRERQPGLGEHMEGVGALAGELGRRLGLEAEDLDEIARAGELHDIGKMAIPDEILGKPGPLDAEEWELMRKHTLIGERMLSVTPALAPVARLIRWSHERWDGTGYPDGLEGAEIPIGSRIIAICDAYEAMTERRPYRQPLSAEEALTELRRNAGTQFDPELVEHFVATISPAAPADAVRI